MRSVLLLSVLMTGACSVDSVHLQHNSTLVNATRGLVLLGNGQGHGAMLDTTCAFDGLGGFVFADVNLPTRTEHIGGAHGDLIVGFSAEGVHEIDARAFDWGTDAWDESRDIQVPGVIDAKATAAGAVYLRRQSGECLVGGRAFQDELSAGDCSSGARLIADLGGDGQWILDRGELRSVSEQGVEHVADADHAAFDRLRGTLLVAQDNVVTRLSPNGAVDLQVELRGPVASLADLGTRNGFAAVTFGSKHPSLDLYDGLGGRMAEIRLPGPEGNEGPAVQVATSDDGRDLSLVTERETHNYTLADGPPNPGQGVAPIEFSD